ncbi:DUF1330 domain-containing protein [Actinomadura verrucosospora]|uniref:DUF1330 domain containing protein n=1 Tax=Actinomadura verrucosospora TaxID=46165 RepID=A0A7D3VRT0_ACTVE|nr:DUF1330 domain-containing protein [Actinomadura verrucosospora]QKG21478.1 DUF1330 domain containing protein [Actinomadura verrucosospora]
MTAYVLGQLHGRPPLHDEVLTYMERIQATMDPFGGRFIVHGETPDVREGTWEGDLVLLEFPDIGKARAWYDSPAYQEIKHLRADHIPGTIMMVDGCGAGHDSAAMAAGIRAAQQGR